MPRIKTLKDRPQYASDFRDWLAWVAPDVGWFMVQEVGDYQGSVYGVGTYQGQILLYYGSFGSCGGCGAWGEGGEPETQEAVLADSKFYATREAAFAAWPKGNYQLPDKDQWIEAIMDAWDYGKALAKKRG